MLLDQFAWKTDYEDRPYQHSRANAAVGKSQRFLLQGFASGGRPRPDFGIPGYWLYGNGKPILHLVESNNHYRAEKPHYLDHVAFEVADLNGYTERLDQLGIEYTVNHIADYNISQVFCHDPCGTGVEANFSQ